MAMYKYLSIVFIIMLASCGQKKNEYDPYAIDNKAQKAVAKTYFEVDFKNMANVNLKTIHVKLNDANGYDAIFDTGCTHISISELEFANLFKAGTITQDDYRGKAKTNIADGSEYDVPVYNIKEVTIVDKDGKPHSVHNVQAAIEKDLRSPILIGNAVIDNLAKRQYTFDLKKRVIRFE